MVWYNYGISKISDYLEIQSHCYIIFVMCVLLVGMTHKLQYLNNGSTNFLAILILDWLERNGLSGMDLCSHLYIYATYISLLDSQGISGMDNIKPKVEMTLIFWNRTTSIFNLLHPTKTERSDIMKGIGDCSFWKRSKCSYFVIIIQNSGTWAFSIGSIIGQRVSH